jgi:hypothetical protein
MLDSVKRFLGRVYLIPVSVESLTHLTLSNRLTGDHLVFLLFILPPARFRFPTLLIKHMTIITSMDAALFLERRNCKSLLYIRPDFHEALDCSLPMPCSDASTIIRQGSYPNASGGLGDVYKCARKYDAASDEVSHRLMFSPCTHSGFRSRSNPLGSKI